MGAAESRALGSHHADDDNHFIKALGCWSDTDTRPSARSFSKRQPTAGFESPRVRRRSVSPASSCRSGMSSVSSDFSDGYGGGVEPHFWA